MMEEHGGKKEILESGFGPLSLDPSCSRRQTLKWGGLSIIGLSVLGSGLAQGAVKPLIIMEQAQGLVVADPMKCVGCGRCELACTEFNDGKASPSLSRIKIDRNLNFGSDGVLDWRVGKGNWGDGLIVQDLCKQCPHPVPCANICPENAIVAVPPGQARTVDLEKCTGCKVCLKACPWEMISFDPDTRKATKCHLCEGTPKCVEACPAGSLSYVPWRDLTDRTPPRVTNTVQLLPDRSAACQQCHLPGQAKNVNQGIGMFRGALKGGRPLSAREFGFRWIDLAGTLLVPLAVVGVVAHAVLRKVVKR
jgi:Fe-S-cluster-containing dehydrogenase component